MYTYIHISYHSYIRKFNMHIVITTVKTFKLPLHHRLVVAIYIDLREELEGVWALYRDGEKLWSQEHWNIVWNRLILKAVRWSCTSECLCIQVSHVHLSHLSDAFNTCTSSIEDDCCRCCKLPSLHRCCQAPVRLGSQTWDVLRQTKYQAFLRSKATQTTLMWSRKLKTSKISRCLIPKVTL